MYGFVGVFQKTSELQDVWEYLRNGDQITSVKLLPISEYLGIFAYGILMILCL